MWNFKLVHDNLRIWEPCQIEVFQRLRSEFYPKSYTRTTLFYIHWDAVLIKPALVTTMQGRQLTILIKPTLSTTRLPTYRLDKACTVNYKVANAPKNNKYLE